MAIETGSSTVTVVPSPGVLSTETSPSSRRAVERTTSIPTPRPEMSVTSVEVDSPGWWISSNTSESVIAATVSRSWTPSSTAVSRIAAGSSPAPSSLTAIETRSPVRSARSVTVPVRGLPAASRSAGGSIP